MLATRRVILVVTSLFTVAVVVASLYTLNHIYSEAREQAGQDLERRIKTFWELLRTKGDTFAVRNGTLMIGSYTVNGNPELPDKIREIFGGTATIFMGNVRISTNVPGRNGERAIGTTLVGPAYDAVFRQGTSYRGETDILGTTYFTAYDPIRDSRGQVIGALYVGVQRGVFFEHYQHLLWMSLAPVLFLTMVTGVLYLMLQKEGNRYQRFREQQLGFLQSLIDALPLPVYYKDIQGRYLGCNTTLETFFGPGLRRWIGKTSREILPHEQAVAYEADDQQLLQEGHGGKHEFSTTMRDASGAERDVIIYKAAFAGPDGSIGGLIGAILDVTDRKAVEERLRASERRMSDIINFLPDATWVVDKDGCVVAWNRACEELTGVKASAMLGQGDLAYAVPFYGTRRPLLIDGALQGIGLEQQEYCALEQTPHVVTAEAFVPCVNACKGAYLWGIACRLYDDKGRVAGAIESVRDVTERRQAELREHTRADILEHIARDASLEEVLRVIVRDIEQEHPELFCSILLKNRQGTHLLHGVAPSLPDCYNAAVNGLRIAEGKGSCGTAAFLRKRVIVADITQHPYWKGFKPAAEAGLKSCWSEPILSSHNELLGTFALYSRTVREPDKEEIRLIETAANYASIAIERMSTVQALRESERNYRELVEGANSIILRLDTTGTITFFNEFAQRFFGYQEEEILGQHVIGTLFDDTELVRHVYAKAIASIATVPEQYALLETENRRKNGERVYVSWSNKACLTEDGRLEEILCIGQDVSERKKMQEMIVQTEKMMTVGGLAAGMAHELNNPIGTIAQHAQNIIRRISSPLPANAAMARETGISLPNLEQYLQRRGITGMLDDIVTACERAAAIISSMLAFSRKSDDLLEPASLPELIEKSIGLATCDYDLKKQYDFKNICVVKEFDPGVPAINVVPLEIEQVLLNLLKNAAHALSANPPVRPPTIAIRLKQGEQTVILEVEDNGPGIAKELRNRVFEPFFTTKEVGVGTGLGLSIAYSIIVNKHQGSISVESSPGKGACFRICLPCPTCHPLPAA